MTRQTNAFRKTLMADTAATPAAKTVAEDMASRRIFATTEEAAAYLNMAVETYSDFTEIPLAAPGMDDEGNFDPEVYTDGMVPMVATLRKNKGGTKAVIVTPVPTLEYLLSDDAGTQWVKKIIEKELNHVAVRALREAEDISTVVDQMPTTRDGYISSARDSGGGIMLAFDELYKLINATLAAKVPAWNKARLVKGELKKAMESAGYASEYYAALEERTNKKGEPESLFVVAATIGASAAKKKGLDPTIFERWLATRDAKKFTAPEESDGDDFDVDSLTESMLTEEAPAAQEEEAPAAE